MKEAFDTKVNKDVLGIVDSEYRKLKGGLHNAMDYLKDSVSYSRDEVEARLKENIQEKDMRLLFEMTYIFYDVLS